MKKLLKVLLLCLMVLGSGAQSFDYLGGISFGDGEGDDDESQEIAFFSNGDLLVAGTYKGLIDFDPDTNAVLVSRSNTFSGEVWFARYSEQGDLIWWQTISSERNINVYDILIDNQENIYITGSYIQEAIFDDGTNTTTLFGVSPNDADGYLAKYTENGNFLWAERFAGTGIDNGVALEINTQGHLALLGVFGDSLQFDPNQSSSLRVSAGAGDVFLAAYDTSNGQFQWVESISGVGFDNPRDLVIDAQGNYYILGDYTSTITFSLNPLTALVSSGGNDIFLAKYNANHQFVWAEKIAGSSTDLASGLELSGDSLLLVSGTFRGNVQLDPAGVQPLRTGNGFNADIFIVALDTAAQYQWGHVFGESSTDRTNGLSLDQSGNVWLGGYFVNTVDFDPDPSTSFNLTGAGGDALLAGYRLSDGGFINAFQISGSSFSQSLDVGVAPNNKIWTVGPIYLSAEFDPLGSGLLYTTPGSGNSNSFFAAYTASQFDTAWVTVDREGGDDIIHESLYMPDGSIVTCGYFEGGFDADPGTGQTMLNSAGSSDVFFARYDNNLNLLWAKSLGGSNADFGSALGVDSSGNIYLGGYYFGTLYFDNNGSRDSIISSTSSASFLAKYNPQGQLLWMQNIDGSNDDYLYDISVNALGEVAVTGYFRATISFDNGGLFLSASNRASFLAVFDSSGTVKWSQKIDGSSNEYGYSCLASRNGNFYFGGSYRNTVDFDPGSGTDSYTSQFGSNDVYISSFDANGNYQWTKVYGNSGFETAWDIAEDVESNLYIAGDFFNTVDFNPGAIGDSLTSLGNTDVFLLSLSESGTFRWVKQLGGSQNDAPRSVKVVADQVYHAGFFSNTADLDPGLGFQWANSNQQTIYLQVLDTLGNFIKAQHFGGIRYDEAWSVDHFQGETLLGGTFETEVDFDPDSLNTVNFKSNGDQDAFIVKLGPAVNCPPYTDTLSVSACQSYTWGNQTYSQSGWYTRTIANPGDCDSLLSLDLTIYPTYDSLLVMAACDSFTWRGQTYFQSGLYYDSLLTSQSCDSVYRLDLSLNSSYSDTLQVQACDSYTWRGTTYTQSGWYSDSLLSSTGCDSVYYLDLDLRPSFSDTLQVQACDSYTWRGMTNTQSGWYSDSLVTSSGCDSVYYLSLNLSYSYSDTLQVQSCDSYTWRGVTYTQSGWYSDSLVNGFGCDSVYYLDLNLSPSFSDTLQVQACDSYTWRGMTYTQSGWYSDSLVTSSGCDSVYYLSLILSYSYSDTLQVQACDSYTWRGTTYTQSGWFSDSLVNSFGCDSVYYLDLNLSPSFSDTLQVQACDSYTWRGTTYNSSGFYSDSLSSLAGCDSIYFLDLSLSPSYFNSTNINACDSFTLKGTVYYNDAYYVDSLQNQQGCDSIEEYYIYIDTLDLRVVSNGFTASALQMGATYQWIDCDNGNQPINGATSINFDPMNFNLGSGNYAVIIELGECLKTSDCVYLQNIGSQEWSLSQPKIWPNPSKDWVNIEFAQAGRYTLEVLDVQGRLVRTWQTAGNSKEERFRLPAVEGSYIIRVQNSEGELWQETVIRR
jgi:hypothetical protein